MIERLDIQFIHMEHDENLEKYVTRKLGRLDRYLPRHARASVHMEVSLKESKAKDGRSYCVEVNLHVPQGVINVSEQSINIYAAVDIVELKVKQQIRKYKGVHSAGTLRRLATRFAR
jgi:ribosomal subunit interface protein